jgi:hypothetical protein
VQKQTIPFVVTDLIRYLVYLGLLWIDAYNSKLNYAMQRMLFQGKKDKNAEPFKQIVLEDAKTFDKSMRDP